MRITFPYMGTSRIAFKHLIENLGHEALVPPAPSKRTLTYGTQYAPEFACIPFKILLGSYIEALNQGAEMIITSGGIGPCRAGIYGMLHEKILKNLGYNFEMIVFEPPLTNIPDFVRKINKVIKPVNVSWIRFLKQFKTSWLKLKTLDEVESLTLKIRPRELSKGETTKVFAQCLDIIDQANSREDIIEAREKAKKLLQAIPQDTERKCLKIGIVGEIYVVLEPFINLDIEKNLGEMGVETHRSIYLTDWSKENAVSGDGEEDIKRVAKPYLSEPVGGHGVSSIGETVIYGKKGFDGVIQLAPFTCIPEIVAKSILPQVSKDYNISVMTIFLDEQTGKAGIQTRLEAFVDLLNQRRMLTREDKTCGVI
ncbi:MAG: CoA protein activase [Clostridia bacterium]|jgi:predicted nucleotide-binding protein (sugar kinase/HSP70/actin superfamily)|nr:CoA protein activase [Clostridia bacterium]